MMGLWRRKISESARQTIPLGRDRHFQPTANSRVVATFLELKKFAEALKKYDRQTTQHVKHVVGNLAYTEIFMNTAVPRIHSDGMPGETGDIVNKIGSTVDYDKLRAAGEAGTQRLQTYVMEPLRSWLKNYDEAVASMQQVEQTRLILDSRRRSVAALEGKLTNIRSKVEDDHDPKLEKCIQKKHRQEMKMNQVLEDFRSREQLLYQNLISLVNDVKYVQQHVHKLFELYREIYSESCEAFLGGHTQQLLAQAPGERQIPVYSHPGATAEAGFEHEVIPVLSQSDHGPGVVASNDGFSYNTGRVEYSKNKRPQDRYAGHLDESGGFYPV